MSFLSKVYAKVKFKVVANDLLQRLVTEINSGGDYAFLMSKAADHLWDKDKERWTDFFKKSGFAEDIQSELDLEDPPETPREAWALNKEFEDEEDGSTKYYFSNPKIMPKTAWYIHFTDGDPVALMSNYVGNNLDTLGLTRLMSHKGDFGFAFSLQSKIPKTAWRYGKNAIIFQADAVEAYHEVDDEKQVIFIIKTMKNTSPLYGNEKTLDLVIKNKSYTLKKEALLGAKLLTLFKEV